MKVLKTLYHRFRELILYGIIGGFCAALDFGIYTLLSQVILYLWANVISVHCGIILSFLLNRQYNFKVKDKPVRRFSIFYLVGLSGLGLSELLLFLMGEKAGWNHLLAKLLTIVVVALYQFELNKLISFKKAN